MDKLKDTIRKKTPRTEDRKSTRLNSSHQIISDAVLCLKKKESHDDHNEAQEAQPLGQDLPAEGTLPVHVRARRARRRHEHITDGPSLDEVHANERVSQ